MKTTFCLFTNDKRMGNQPMYRSSTFGIPGLPGTFRVVCWEKMKEGNKFLSCVLEDAFGAAAKKEAGPTMDENIAMLRRTQEKLGGKMDFEEELPF